MNIKFSLSDLKDKVNTIVLLVIALVLLAGLLGVASYFTITETINVQERINVNLSGTTENMLLVSSLEKMKANSKYYEAQQEEYDKVIAAAGSYDTVDYYVELDDLCRRYNLDVVEISVGEIEEGQLAKQAVSTLSVVGDEVDIRRMAVEIVSQEQIARIDTIAMAEQQDGSVAATIVIINFTK